MNMTSEQFNTTLKTKFEDYKKLVLETEEGNNNLAKGERMTKGKHNKRKNKHAMDELKTKMMHMPGGYCYPLKTVDKQWLKSNPLWRSTIVVSGFSRHEQDIERLLSTSSPVVGITRLNDFHQQNPKIQGKLNSFSKSPDDSLKLRIMSNDANVQLEPNLPNQQRSDNIRNCSKPRYVVSYNEIVFTGADIGSPPKGMCNFWELQPPNDRLTVICMDGDSFSLEIDKNKAAPLATVRSLKNSFIVLAAFTLSDKLKKDIRCNGNDDVEALKISRNSVLQNNGTQHHMSSGEYYSFGLKGSYERAVNGVSIGVYKGTYTSNQKTRFVQHKIDRAMEIGQRTFEHYMPGLWASAFIVLKDIADLAREKHILKGPRNEKVLNDTHGVLCVNATTKIPHNEIDGSYTVGIVPSQQCENKNEYFFIFHLTNSVSIRLPMKPGVVFLYNAYLITHQQICTKKCQQYYFQNYTRYCSKRLMQTAGATMNRENEKKKETN